MPQDWYDRSIHTSWRLFAQMVRALRGGEPSAAFARDGYVTGVLPATLVADCVAMIDAAPRVSMHRDDAAPGFRRSEKVEKVAPTLNAGHRYFLPAPAARAPLERLCAHLAPVVREAAGVEGRVVNTRILQTLPTAAIMGPNAWHGDGFPPEMLKIMVYLSAPGAETGTTEIQHPDGTTTLIAGPPGTWMLFRNSTLIHRGLPPRTAPRLAIELTIVPALVRSAVPLFAGLNATYPEYPWSLHPLFARHRASMAPGGKPVPSASLMTDAPVPGSRDDRAAHKAARAAEKQAAAAAKAAAGARRAAQQAAELRRRRRIQRVLLALNRIVPPVAVNIGGGAEFVHFRWRNLEASPGPANPSPFQLHPACRFPLRDASVRTVYTSHCLEHLDDATVARVLEEAHRVLVPGGRLVVKLPDFDRALAAWQADDAEFLDADRWGLRRLAAAWPEHGVEDSLDARAAMIFCGFWNDAYGDHFSDRRNGAGAYHGPPRLAGGQLRQLRTGESPHAVAAALRTHVERTEPSYHFNHQNAWSRRELAGLLAAAGFEVVTDETARVIEAAADIPTIAAARAESLYCLASRHR